MVCVADNPVGDMGQCGADIPVGDKGLCGVCVGLIFL